MRRALENLLALMTSLGLLAGAAVLLHRQVSVDDGRLAVARDGGAVLADAPITFDVGGAPGRAPVFAFDDGGPGDLPAPAMTNGRLVLAPGSLAPGVHAVSWEVRYLGRRPREAAFAVMAGPFGEEGAAVSCGVRVAVGREAMQAIASPLRDAVREGIDEVPVLPAARSVSLVPHLVDDGLDVVIDVAFDEGSHLNAMVPLALLLTPEGDLAVRRRGPAQATASGSLGTMAAIRGGGITAALEALAREPRGGLHGAVEAAREAGGAAAAREIEMQVDRWLPEVNRELARRLPRRLSMVLGDARVVLELSPCDAPLTHGGRALVIRYDARPRITASGARQFVPAATRASLPGPLRARGQPLDASAPDRVAGLTVTFSEDLLNAVVHEAWRAGALDRVVADPDQLEALNATLSSFSALQVASVALDLPPFIAVEARGLRATLGELRLGMTSAGEPAPDVVAIAEADVRTSVSGLRVHLGLEATRVRASCSVSENGLQIRRPCLSDLIGEAEAMLGERAALDLTVPVQDFADGFNLTLEGIRVRPGELDLVATLEAE